MKLNSLSMMCLSLLLIHTHFSMAKRGGGFGRISFGKTFGSGSKKTSTSSRSSAGAAKTGPKSATNQGSSSQSTYPRQPSGGVYHDKYSILGSPNRGNDGQGSYGKYGGGYMNYNPKNRVLSPRFGGRFGYGGYGAGGGSPYSQAVQEVGMMPSEKSRKYGRKAMMAAAGGAMAGMALGYGLGRFPRPHFNFHSPQEEYYYNHYMYRKYGVKSTDTNDYSRDYTFSKPPLSYDNYMDRCMKRTDLLPGENRQPNSESAATTTTTTTTTTSVTTTSTAATDTGIGSNTTKTNSTATGSDSTMTHAAAADSDATKTNNTAANSNATKTNSAAADNSSTSTPSTNPPLNEPQANPVPPAPQGLTKTATDDDDDDDTVSIVEIGYPSLINQLKVRRCLELYMVYSDKYLEKKVEPRASTGRKGQEMGSGGLLAVVTSTILMLLNSNMLMLLH